MLSIVAKVNGSKGWYEAAGAVSRRPVTPAATPKAEE
jgi:hypothetical protein